MAQTDSLLAIGDFYFDLDDFPEEIPLGGQQQVQVIKYPGGYREVQVFGAQDDTISWSGVLNYSNAVDKMERLDAMFKSGNVYGVSIGVLPPFNAIITSFKPVYRSQYEIPYTISIEKAPYYSLLIPTGAAVAGSGDGSTSTTTAPDANAPAPQRTYIVKQGDSLWKIAARELGDGSRFREITALNTDISDPNAIQVGQRLVLPS